MISREDQTWTNVVNNGGIGETQTTLFEIALSLGRIADMLAEMNDYIVEYGEQQRATETHDAVPVIRCKDCKYWRVNTQFCAMFSGLSIAHRMPPNGYCSEAVRKEE